jgi:hypothetical protein
MKKNVSPSHTAAVDFAKKAFRFLSLFIAFLSCSCFANAQGIISTIVGNGTAGYSGDGGAATAAELY